MGTGGALSRRINGWLAHPATRGIALDDPRLTGLRRQVIAEKPFLRRLYREWYQLLAGAIPPGPGQVVELGSGAGFLGQVVPGLIASEISWSGGVQLVLDGRRLPFAPGSLKAIVMTDVLHHIPEPRAFFSGACRALRRGGKILLIEPWVTPWSRAVYRSLHHEPFQPDAPAWEFPPSGPLSSANGALPWILFERDRAAFETDYPALQIERISPLMPFSYLLSGGVSLRSLAPGWSYPVCRGLEKLLSPWNTKLAMFACIVLHHTG